MRGFWTNQTVQQKVDAGVYGSTPNVHPCEACGLYKDCINPYMPLSGEGRLGILGIGEGPGFNEDQRNTQFVGEAGQLLAKHFAQYNINIYEDFYLTNAIHCRATKQGGKSNRTPTAKEIGCCRGFVWEHIAQAQPRFILLMGESAVKSFFGDRFSDTAMARWVNLCIPDPETGAWVIPIYHPSFALRSSKDRNKLSTFERCIKFAVSCFDLEPPTFPDFESMVETSTDYNRIREALQYVIMELEAERSIYFVFDYETTALKPWGYGHDILTCSFAVEDDWCFSFPVSYPGVLMGDQVADIKSDLKYIMESPYAFKIAHNLQFEDMWTRVKLRLDEVENWEWCTMNGAHALDSRRAFCSLKFQAYINYGVYGYEKELKKYMEGRQPGTHLNRLHEVPINDLLLYGGLDSIITRHLYHRQAATLNRSNDPRTGAYQLFVQGLQYLNDATIRGIPTDPIYYNEQVVALNDKIKEVENKLLRGKVAQTFRQHAGKPLTIVDKDFSSVDLRVVLYDILNIKSTKQTGTGLKSVDKEVLADIKHPWVKLLLKRRRLHKLLNTYVAGLVRAMDEQGIIHPLYPLHTARTYRGSSTDPNWQNQPNRDKESKKLVRTGIMADPGWHLGAVDYGSMEVRIAACCSRDPKLVWYCEQTGSDLHQDVAERIWALPGNEVSSGIRFHSKGGFVFAEVYGSFYVNCAVTMWEECLLKEKTVSGVPLRDHLKNVGIIDGANSSKTKYRIRGTVQTVPRHLAQFIEHVKGVETWFWEEFAMLREWQERLVSEYQQKGYVEMFFGFRRGGLLTNNKIFNTAIQGTAFHCLLWSFNHMTRWCNAWMEGGTIGEIHDEIMYHMPSNEVQGIISESEWVMCHEIREHFDWIIVPLVAEPELSPPGGSWANMHELVKDNTGKWVLKEEA